MSVLETPLTNKTTAARRSNSGNSITNMFPPQRRISGPVSRTTSTSTGRARPVSVDFSNLINNGTHATMPGECVLNAPSPTAYSPIRHKKRPSLNLGLGITSPSASESGVGLGGSYFEQRNGSHAEYHKHRRNIRSEQWSDHSRALSSSSTGLSNINSVANKQRPRSIQLAMEQERHIQEHLQRLARSENAKLDVNILGDSNVAPAHSSRPPSRGPSASNDSPWSSTKRPYLHRASPSAISSVSTSPMSDCPELKEGSPTTPLSPESAPFSPNPEENIFVITCEELQRLSLDNYFSESEDNRKEGRLSRQPSEKAVSKASIEPDAEALSNSAENLSGSHKRTFSWEQTRAIIHSSATSFFAGKAAKNGKRGLDTADLMAQVPMSEIVQALRENLVDPEFLRRTVAAVAYFGLKATVTTLQFVLLLVMALSYFIGDMIVTPPQKIYNRLVGDENSDTSNNSAHNELSSSTPIKSKKTLKKLARAHRRVRR